MVFPAKLTAWVKPPTILLKKLAAGAVRQGIGVLLKERGSISWSGIASNALNSTISEAYQGMYPAPVAPDISNYEAKFTEPAEADLSSKGIKSTANYDYSIASTNGSVPDSLRDAVQNNDAAQTETGIGGELRLDAFLPALGWSLENSAQLNTIANSS